MMASFSGYTSGAFGNPYQHTTSHMLGQSQVPGSGSGTAEQNVNPFYLKILAGNIRICQGCRGSLRLLNGNIPDPSYDIVVARLEKRPYRDQSGMLKTPYRASAAHYHARLACVSAGDPSFIPYSLVIPPDVSVQLSLLHRQHLQQEFRMIV